MIDRKTVHLILARKMDFISMPTPTFWMGKAEHNFRKKINRGSI